MIKFFRKCCKSKRECVTYLVIFLWVNVGIVATFFDTSFTDLAAYFVSLIGFITAYILGESVRQSEKTSIFSKGTTSRREIVMYITIALWLIVGIFVIVKNSDLLGMSAYFAALTPFVGSYIIGETYKGEKNSSENFHESSQINS
jgi:hypothetical protein